MTKRSNAQLVREDVEQFLKLQVQMQELLLRMTAISAKAPDQPINKFKLSVINEQLQIANRILVDASRPLRGFEMFDETALPSNSDVVMVVSQYLACLEAWRSNHVIFDAGEYVWRWNIDGGDRVQTDQPTKKQTDKV